MAAATVLRVLFPLVVLYVAIAAADGGNCCAPSQWVVSGLEVNALGSVSHTIYYDAINQLLRWDRTGNLLNAAQVETLITWVNYTSLDGWAYFPNRNNTCEELGPDHMEKWCYGTDQAQTYAGQIVLAGANVSRWYNSANGFEWFSSVPDCEPVGIRHGGDMLLFYNFSAGPIDPSVWKFPTQYCDRQNLNANGASLIKRLGLVGGALHANTMSFML